MLIVQAPRELSGAKLVLTISVLPGVCYIPQATVCLMASKVHVTAPYPVLAIASQTSLACMTPALQAASCTAMVYDSAGALPLTKCSLAALHVLLTPGKSSLRCRPVGQQERSVQPRTRVQHAERHAARALLPVTQGSLSPARLGDAARRSLGDAARYPAVAACAAGAAAAATRAANARASADVVST